MVIKLSEHALLTRDMRLLGPCGRLLALPTSYDTRTGAAAGPALHGGGRERQRAWLERYFPAAWTAAHFVPASRFGAVIHGE